MYNTHFIYIQCTSLMGYIIHTCIESEQNNLMHVLDVNVQCRKSESHKNIKSL